jgi:uncharacterized protein (TIGR03067 family)
MPKQVTCISALIALVVLAVAGAWAQTGKSSLEGIWVGVSMEMDGEQADAALAKRMRFKFEGDVLIIAGNFSDESQAKCSFRLNETASPKHLDFTPEDEKKPLVGIYERNGRNLKLCIRQGRSDKGRPMEFITTKDSDLVLMDLVLQMN